MREKGVRCRWLKTEAGVLRETERERARRSESERE